VACPTEGRTDHSQDNKRTKVLGLNSVPSSVWANDFSVSLPVEWWRRKGKEGVLFYKTTAEIFK
jgi:hypothetical protein